MTKSKAIAQSFFKFLVEKSSDKSNKLLKSVCDVQKTSTELNYIPTGKASCSLKHK